MRYKDHLSKEHNVDYCIDWILDKTLSDNATSSVCQSINPPIVITDDSEVILEEIHPPCSENETVKNQLKVPSPRALDSISSPRHHSTSSNPPFASHALIAVSSVQKSKFSSSAKKRKPVSSAQKLKLVSSTHPEAKKVKLKLGKMTLKFNVKTQGQITAKNLGEARQKMKKTAFGRVSPSERV